MSLANQTLPLDECINVLYGLEGFKMMMRVIFAILMMGMGIGYATSMMPDSAKVLHLLTLFLYLF